MRYAQAGYEANSLTGNGFFAVIAGSPERASSRLGSWPRGAQPQRASPPNCIAGPIMKRTYQASKVRRARTHGFLVRMKTRGGRAVINARRAKGRKRLAV